MNTRTRRGITLFELLVVLALFVIFLALMLPLVAQLRESAIRAKSMNNLKQLGLAAFGYHDAHRVFPPGVDNNGFSAKTYLLPYIEQDNLFRSIDMKKAIDDKANAEARRARVLTFESSLDAVKSVTMDYGPTNYLFCSGISTSLKQSEGMYYLNSRISVVGVTDGTSNTIVMGETSKGDSGVRAMTVLRQHVKLTKDDLAELKPNTGVDLWKKDKKIAADRCASWMDGSFLQGTFNTQLKINDTKPDVDCGGIGGYSSLRTARGTTVVGFCDGSVRVVTPKISLPTWRALSTRAGGEVVNFDF